MIYLREKSKNPFKRKKSKKSEKNLPFKRKKVKKAGKNDSLYINKRKDFIQSFGLK
jgi:hypothetical protein